MAATTYMGKPCRNGHSGERYKNGHCVECRILSNATYRESQKSERSAPFVQGIPKEFARQRDKELKARNERLAAIRAQRTERQRACAYGVRV